MHRRLRGIHWLLAAVLCSACGDNNTPEPPETPGNPGGGNETVTGSERLGWVQVANAVDLPTIHFAIYIDGTRSELAGTLCQPTSDDSAFQCSAPLPALSAGPHTIELAAYIVEGEVLESPRSAPLQLVKASLAAAPVPNPAATWPGRMSVSTVDGVQLRLDRIAEGLSDPSDLAFAPDGRLFIAEEQGRVRVLKADGSLAPDAALTLDAASGPARLLALSVDTRFEETRFAYVLSTRATGDGGQTFTLTRYQESGDHLNAPIVLLDGVATRTPATGSVRVDKDGTLFVALDDGGNPQQAGDLSVPNGKMLRLNPDGTTPSDQAGLTPMYAADLRSPRGFEWHPQSRLLWLADQISEGVSVIKAIGAAPGPSRRGLTLASYALPRGTRPSSVAFYDAERMPAFRNNLLIASEQGQHLLRLRFDPADPTRVIATERLLRNTIGGIRAVSVSADGRIVLATSNAIATLAPPAP